jgi:signal transduction histidine kinase
MASNGDGLWNGSEAAVGFEVEPTIWQTWWFRLTFVSCVGLAALSLYRLRMRQVTRLLSIRFEERLAERARIARDLHDTLLQGVLGTYMQLHVAVDQLPNESPSRPAMNRILQLMEGVVEEGRIAVQGLRPPLAGSQDLEQAFSKIQHEFAVIDKVDFRIIVEGRPRPLNPVLRDEVYKIGREALVNAFRHSRAKSIEVELDYGLRFFRCLVRDNGRGIDANVLRSGREGHWGLPGMRERAEKIEAQLHVRSSSSAGTEVELSIPSHTAFQFQPSKRWPGWLTILSSLKRRAGDRETR